MRHRARGPLLLLLAGTCLPACQTTHSYLLSGIGLQKKPLAIAVVLDDKPSDAVAALNPFPRYAALQKALGDDLERPVAVDPCFSFQAQQGLKSGWYGSAIMTPAQFSRLPRDAEWQVLAVPVDLAGRGVREAVLVVGRDSEFQSAADLRGKVVAFGPRDDGRTHHAALKLLRDAGLQKTDLSLEPLPLPGSLRHMPDMRSIAQAVINGSAAAGFIDVADWESFAEHAAQPGDPARDELRVIGRTVRLPSRLVVASPKLDDATVRKYRAFLLAAGREHPEVLEPLQISGYQLPDDEMLAACRSLATGEPVAEPE